MSPSLGTTIGPKLNVSSFKSFKKIVMLRLERPYRKGELLIDYIFTCSVNEIEFLKEFNELKICIV
jgi:hypothetical protein